VEGDVKVGLFMLLLVILLI